MSSALGITSRGEKGKSKYLALDINNLYKGKSLEIQKSTVVPKYGLQTLGKITAGRRMPPPANLPSLKSENCGNNPNINLVPCGGQGWGTNTEENLSSSSSQPSQLPSALSTSQKESGVKTWSSVCSSTVTPPPTFPKEFPELNAVPDQTSNSNAPQLSLRPQSSGNWSQGSKPPDPPQSSGNGDRGGTRHGNMRSDAEHGRRDPASSGHPVHHQQPQSDRSKQASMAVERKKYSQTDHRNQPFSDGQPNAIVCEKDLKVFDEILQDPKSSWSTSTHEIDYNARLDFCDDDDEEEDEATVKTEVEPRTTPDIPPQIEEQQQQPKVLLPQKEAMPPTTGNKEPLLPSRTVEHKKEEVNIANHTPETPVVYPNLVWHGGKETQPVASAATHYDLMRGYAAASTTANWMPTAQHPPAPCRYNTPTLTRTTTYQQQYPPQPQMLPPQVQRLGYEEQLWYGSKQHTSEHMTATVERARMQRFEEERRLEMSKYGNSNKIEEMSVQAPVNYNNRNPQQPTHQPSYQRHYNKDVPPRFQKQAGMKHHLATHHGTMPLSEVPKPEKQAQDGNPLGYRNLPPQQQKPTQQSQPSFQDGWHTGKNLPEGNLTCDSSTPTTKPQQANAELGTNYEHKVNSEVFYKKASKNEDVAKLPEAMKPPIIGSFMPRGEMSRFGRGGIVVSAPPRASISNYGPPPLKPGFGPKKEDEGKQNPRPMAPPIGAIPMVMKQEKSASPTFDSGPPFSSAPFHNMSDSNKNQYQGNNSDKDPNKPYAEKPNGHEQQHPKTGDPLPPRFQRRYPQPHHNHGRGRPNRPYREGGDFYKEKEDRSKEEPASAPPSNKLPHQKNNYRTGGGNGNNAENNGNNRRPHRGYPRGHKGGGNRDDMPPKTDEDGQIHHLRRQVEKTSFNPPNAKMGFTSGSEGQDSISGNTDFPQDASNSNYNNNKPKGGPNGGGGGGKKPPRKEGKGGGGGGGGGGGNGNRYREKKLPPRFAKQKELEKMKVTGDNNAGSC